jgi:RNA polymerase sigma-70 factor, ECF subfamily
VNDLELVSACADGDNNAWTVFLERYDKFLYFIIRRCGFSETREHEVDDFHDEILAWLLGNEGRVLRSFRGESKLTSWLGVVVTRQVRRLIKRKIQKDGGTVSLDALSLDAGTELADQNRNDRAGYKPEAIDALRTAISSLADRDRKLLIGFFIEKRRYEDLAKELGLKEASIGQLLFRAKNKLKKKLGGESFLEKLSGWIPFFLYLPGSLLS